MVLHRAPRNFVWLTSDTIYHRMLEHAMTVIIPL
jgi:hypothetical protein